MFVYVVVSYKSDTPPQAAKAPCVQCPDNRGWFLEQLAHLSQQVDRLQTQVKHCDCSNQQVNQMEASELEAAIRRALKLYDADKTGMADYALESAG